MATISEARRARRGEAIRGYTGPWIFRGQRGGRIPWKDRRIKPLSRRFDPESQQLIPESLGSSDKVGPKRSPLIGGDSRSRVVDGGIH